MTGTAGGSESGSELKSLEETNDLAKPRPRRRRKWKRWTALAILSAALVWLNGPGIRWLAPKVADHLLPKAGLRGSFALDGSLTGGLTVRDLRLEGDKALALLTVDRLTLDYRLSKLAKGQIDGVEIDGLHADLRLGLDADGPEEEKTPLDLEKLVETLRSVRTKVIPLEVDLKGISLNASRDGKPVIALANTRIRHKAGEPRVDLDIGTITDAAGREWPARESAIVWNEDDLKIDRIDPLPGIGLRNLVVKLPASGGPSADMELHVDDAVLVLNAAPGFSSVLLSLREGRLASETLAGHFGMKLPASAELSSLSMNVENLLPDPKAATGAVQILLEKVAYEEWSVPELSMDAGLEDARATVAVRGLSLDTEFSLKAEAALGREAGGFRIGDACGHVNVAAVSNLIAALAQRFDAINPEARAPVSMLDGDFTVSFSDNKPASADVDLRLKPAEPETASSLAVKGQWTPGQPFKVRVGGDGLMLDAGYDVGNTTYQGKLELTEFKSARIDPWLEIVKAGTMGVVTANGNWNGGGSVKDKTHHGTLVLGGVDVTRKDAAPIHSQGEIQYDWPKGFSTKDLEVKADGQTVTVDLMLADNFLRMSDLLWRDGEREMAAGSANLPVPEDFSKWREMLAEDSRPVTVSVKSKVLPLESLKNWFPVAAKIDPRSTGRVELKVSGTYAEPDIDVLLEAKELRSPEQADLPPADLKVTLAGRDGHLAVNGKVTAKDFPPAVMTASMPFRPGEWAKNPGMVMEENISARVDLPRIDLSRFTALVPGAGKLAGFVTGNIEVAGQANKPAVKGKVDLTGCAVEMKRVDVPPVSGLGLSVDLALDRITVTGLKANVASGTVTGGGSLELQDGKPGALDFRIQGRHLPLKRDKSLIVRANADLRLAGPWEQAALTGSIGVVNSLFFQDIELLPIGSPFTGPSAAALPKIDAVAKPGGSLPAPFGNWKLDVRVLTENPFLIRGNIATGEVGVNLRVGGTLANPAPDGVVSLKDIRAELPFSTLKIPSGTVRFTPASGLDPILEIRGNAEPRPYRVNVFVYGRASDPQMVLTSNPPLPENEIMTLLATGTTTSGLEDPQAASSRALQLVAEELRRGRFVIGKQLRPVLGLLDRVDFTVGEADPYSSTSYSTATIEITDRWLLSAGIGAEGNSRVLAIWRLRFY